MSVEKNGFMARRARGAARYIARRFGNPFINRVGRDVLTAGVAGAKSAMIPGKFDLDEFRAGLSGRHNDGGAARFAEKVLEEGITDGLLLRMARNRRRSARAMLASAVIFLMTGAYLMVSAPVARDMVFGFSTAFSALVFVALGIRHDFSRWQIENRRFGGFREYLKGFGGHPAGVGSNPTGK